MTRDDARSFLMALNGIMPYVPPMLMTQITANPVARLIEQVANHDAAQAQTGEAGPPQERPKPHAVS